MKVSERAVAANAKRRGAKAFYAGKSLQDNPYLEDSPGYDVWIYHFQASERVHKWTLEESKKNGK